MAILPREPCRQKVCTIASAKPGPITRGPITRMLALMLAALVGRVGVVAESGTVYAAPY